MVINDVRATKGARAKFGKFGLDLLMADVRVTHGVCFVRGSIQALPKVNLKSVEQTTIDCAKSIKQLPEVKEVVLECSYKEPYFN
jgi:hypothetical protein